jgi:hypothetical protein
MNLSLPMVNNGLVKLDEGGVIVACHLTVRLDPKHAQSVMDGDERAFRQKIRIAVSRWSPQGILFPTGDWLHVSFCFRISRPDAHFPNGDLQAGHVRRIFQTRILQMNFCPIISLFP